MSTRLKTFTNGTSRRWSRSQFQVKTCSFIDRKSARKRGHFPAKAIKSLYTNCADSVLSFMATVEALPCCTVFCIKSK
ncbi:hypothetical protein B0I18_107142 [Taibaiella chishuiensis]|uniref:Uncharacterized protein n=1 Tax=Taibaiella chishuiensis TaxID=1434707 RepID=A0A2P8D0I3_9BACT|nr:hypothetical protein B0I18_107142 [Taibaiella chishuiensis]